MGSSSRKWGVRSLSAPAHKNVIKRLIMPYKDLQKRNAYKIQWAKEHPESRRLTHLKYYRTHKDQFKIRADRYRNRRVTVIMPNYQYRIKIDVFTHYSKGKPICACCRESIFEFLTIDHINGGGTQERNKTKRNGGYVFYRWLQKNNYPLGYQVLCYNCNCGKRTSQICPHNY